MAAGGGDGLDLLDSLRPLILQLVKEAVAQAIKDIVPGAGASANATPQQSASQSRRSRAKAKGPVVPGRPRKLPRSHRARATAKVASRMPVRAPNL